ncbi:GTPase activating protein [Zalerion maritima]|uniref:GTPase activating protein n=1 Tax=Zalerion maritima TaxID=339359 RepID=A0AAD5WUP5_9PEZI|nr:GTPase activating protein [Zalerion maritima]
MSPRWGPFASPSSPLREQFPASPRSPISPYASRGPSRFSDHPSPTFSDNEQTPAPFRAYQAYNPGRTVSESVDNFSRPRKPSIRQAQLADSDILPWPRSRGQSTSSNKSAATFASLPVRPSDYEHRLRARNATTGATSLARPPLPHSNYWGGGSEELRSSYRSQLSASTAQQTVETERSSVLTKASSVTSMAEEPEDELSVEDVMGMYEKGFDDDSDPKHDGPNGGDGRTPGEGDRPTRSRSNSGSAEITRRLTRTLEMFDKIQIPGTLANVQKAPSHPMDSSVPSEDLAPSSLIASTLSGSADQTLPPMRSPSSQPALRPSEPSSPEPLLPELTVPMIHPSPLSSAPIGPSSQPPPPPQPTPSPPEEPPEEPGSRDRYGFRKKNQYVSRQQYDSWNKGYEVYLERRKKKWQQYLRDNGLITLNPTRFPPPNTKTKRFIRKGIPPEWRGAAWFYYAGGPAILAKHGGVYDDMIKRKAKEVDVEAIERDLHRTFPDNNRFKPPGETGEPAKIAELRRVLHAFSIFNPKIGYCQSLNFIAGMLLLFVETEEQCFWLLNIITRIYLPGTHDLSLEGSKVDLGVLMQSLQESMPLVWAKVGGDIENENRGGRFRRGTSRRAAEPDVNRLPPITLSMTAWFMSCFIGTLPIEPTLRVWDVFFYEGSKTLFRIALTIFKLGEGEIRALKDPMEMFELMQSLPRKLFDANAVLEGCFKRRNGFGHLSQDTIDARRKERRDAGRKDVERMRIATEASSSAAGGDEERDARKGMFGRRSRKETMVQPSRDRSVPPTRMALE